MEAERALAWSESDRRMAGKGFCPRAGRPWAASSPAPLLAGGLLDGRVVRDNRPEPMLLRLGQQLSRILARVGRVRIVDLVGLGDTPGGFAGTSGPTRTIMGETPQWGFCLSK